MPKEIKLQHVGWYVSGEVALTLWDGSKGTIDIKPTFVPLGKMTRDNLYRCINDNGFGARSIDAATLWIHERYSHGTGTLNSNSIDHDPRFFIVNDPDPRLVCRGI